MRKPLLLLIDDDRSVLGALEAELGPEFGSLCRIEAFDDPLAVAAQLPRWTAEERRVALAIVDQRMPAMTGVELLSELRSTGPTIRESSFDPTAHMRALMLTGYAGLDSAVAAKNDGGVDGYLEKPWNRSDLANRAKASLRTFSSTSGHGTHFVFREVNDPTEVMAILRLRFAVYARTAGVDNVLPHIGREQVDVDAYDPFSRLFGLFEESYEQSRLVGTLRVVGDSRTPLSELLEKMLPSDSPYGARLRHQREAALPMLEYLVDRETVAALVEGLRASNEPVVEPGRLALDPSYREGGARGVRHLARHIIEGSVSFFFFFLRIPHAILTCIPPHDAFYRPYGFTNTAGIPARFTPYLQSDIACLHGQADRVPEPARTRCNEIAQLLSLGNAGAGGACQCPSYPSCLGGPYGTQDFSVTDIWCPALAARFLKKQGVAAP